jgi:tRNA(Ile2) C34 agmatinyltransferase TiaS
MGNYASFIEFAIKESDFERVLRDIQDFLQYKTVSEQTAIAVMRGVLLVPIQLKEFANKVREKEIPISEADRVAKELHIDLIEITGERGKVGALESSCLINPETRISIDSL